jgi:hypothetical protein
MYKLNTHNNELEEMQETTFVENQLKERQHIEEWIRKNPEILGEELLIIGHEYDKFEVNERLDLLALDKGGNLVIIEVKRDITGGHVDFQALKYASYCSRLNPKDVLEIYEEYIKNHALNLNAVDELVSFLEVEDEEALNDIINQNQRIIVTANEIDKRIPSVCTWLYENNIDIKCVSIKPYKLANQLIIDTNQIIPPDKLEDFYVSKKVVLNDRKIHVNNEVSNFLQTVTDQINGNTDYRVRYDGRRSYAKGVQFLNKPLNFVLGYAKKKRCLSIHLESKRIEGQEILTNLYANDKEGLKEYLGYEVDLTQGSKNEKWYRLIVTIPLDEDKGLKAYLEMYLKVFVKYKKFVEEKIESLNC